MYVVLCFGDLQSVSVDDMCCVQCSSSDALCRWSHLRELGIFAQMYEKQLVKNRFFFFFYVQYAIKMGMNLCYLLMFYPTACSCFKCCFERAEENILKGKQSPPFSLRGLLMRQDINIF